MIHDLLDSKVGDVPPEIQQTRLESHPSHVQTYTCDAPYQATLNLSLTYKGTPP
jgi:hypothetical protein